MPLSDYLVASGQRVHRGQTGCIYLNEGEIWISAAARLGVDSNLFACLKIVVDALKLEINLASIDTGHHVLDSRHEDGRAVDIDMVNRAGDERALCNLENPDALRLVAYLLANGFRAGEGPHNPGPALLFGPAHTTYNPSDIPHAHHLHVSLGKVLRLGEGES